MDDGFLSDTHAELAQRRNGSSKSQAPSSKQAPNFNLQTFKVCARESLVWKRRSAVTQLAYAGVASSRPRWNSSPIRENVAHASRLRPESKSKPELARTYSVNQHPANHSAQTSQTK